MLRPGGVIYTITDVEELHKWIAGKFEGTGDGEDRHCGAQTLFERVASEEEEADECVAIMKSETEEGKKVSRNGGEKFVACWRRLPDPPWPGE